MLNLSLTSNEITNTNHFVSLEKTDLYIIENNTRLNILSCLGARSTYPIFHAKHHNDVFNSNHPPTPERQLWPIIFGCCKTFYISTIGNRITAKDQPSIRWQLYLTKIKNITVKIQKFLPRFTHDNPNCSTDWYDGNFEFCSTKFS